MRTTINKKEDRRRGRWMETGREKIESREGGGRVSERDREEGYGVREEGVRGSLGGLKGEMDRSFPQQKHEGGVNYFLSTSHLARC